MRNNEERIGSPVDVASAPGQVEQRMVESGELSFPVYEEIVDLPSEGKYYNPNHPLCGKKTVSIKYPSTKEQDILNNKSYIKKGIFLDRLIDSVLLDKRITAASLLSADRSAIVMKTRTLMFGPLYKSKAICTNCGTFAPEKDINLDSVSTIYAGASEEELNKNGIVIHDVVGYKTFIMTLPKLGYEYEFKLFTGEDENVLGESSKEHKMKKEEEAEISDHLRQITVAIGGQKDRKIIKKFVERVTGDDIEAIFDAYALAAPKFSVRSSFICEACDTCSEADVRITPEFFLRRR